jgi:hypothetical protein
MLQIFFVAFRALTFFHEHFDSFNESDSSNDENLDTILLQDVLSIETGSRAGVAEESRNVSGKPTNNKSEIKKESTQSSTRSHTISRVSNHLSRAAQSSAASAASAATAAASFVASSVTRYHGNARTLSIAAASKAAAEHASTRPTAAIYARFATDDVQQQQQQLVASVAQVQLKNADAVGVRFDTHELRANTIVLDTTDRRVLFRFVI